MEQGVPNGFLLQKHKNMYATNHQKITNNVDGTKVDTDSCDFNPRTGYTA